MIKWCSCTVFVLYIHRELRLLYICTQNKWQSTSDFSVAHDDGGFAPPDYESPRKKE